MLSPAGSHTQDMNFGRAHWFYLQIVSWRCLRMKSARCLHRPRCANVSEKSCRRLLQAFSYRSSTLRWAVRSGLLNSLAHAELIVVALAAIRNAAVNTDRSITAAIRFSLSSLRHSSPSNISRRRWMRHSSTVLSSLSVVLCSKPSRCTKKVPW